MSFYKNKTPTLISYIAVHLTPVLKQGQETLLCMG